MATLLGAGVVPGLPVGSFAPAPSAVVTPAPCRVPGGPVLRYVVVFVEGTPGRAAEADVIAACGATTAYYPEIAVGVATSADPGFADRMGRDRAYSAQAETLPLPRLARAPRGGAQRVRAETAVIDRAGEQWNMKLIRADRARAVEDGSRDVLVGVLDSGVDPRHPELVAALDRDRSAGCLTGRADRREPAWTPTSSTHGTLVAGTIAAADDDRGVTGVAPGVRVASVKTVDDDGFIYPEYAVCGFMWAARTGMAVTNNSYFVDPWLFTCRWVPGQAVAHEAVSRAVRYASQRGVLAVAAAGNQGADLAAAEVDTRSPDNVTEPRPRRIDESCDVLPAELPSVVAVSSVGAQRVKAPYSSYGLHVIDVAAPGGDPEQRPRGSSSGCVLSTVPGGGYGYACGTSMAAPHAAGVVALLASRHPGARPEELTRWLAEAADSLGCPASYDPDDDGGSDATCTGDVPNGFYGHGVVDALAAVTR